MPRKSKPGATYPPDWKDIARRVKDEANWRCVRCGAPHEDRAGHTLTVHHLSMDPGDNRWHNLAALCCPCHLQIQHKVDLDRPWVMGEHSEWFKPYVAAHYASKYLGLELTRRQTMGALDLLLPIERGIVVQGISPAALREAVELRLLAAVAP